MSAIRQIQFAKVVRPMKTTFATSLGAKTCATSVIVKVVLDDGGVGIGEVPTSFVFPHETVEAIKDILAQTKHRIVGRPIEEHVAFIRGLRKEWPQFHMTVSGLEVAMFRAWLSVRGKNEFCYWGKKSRTLETDITIPFVPQIDILDTWLGRAIRTGFRVYKVKVGGDVETDIKFVEAIYRRLTNSLDTFAIRLDGNQGYTAASCLAMLDALGKKKMAVELFEQPLKRDDYAGFKQIYKRSSTPIIADETVFCPDDCKRVIDDQLAHGVNIKIAKSGITDSQEILKLAKQAKLKLMIGCMTETMIGLSAAICFAAGTNAFDYIDLDSVHFLHHKNSYDGLTISGKYYNIK